MTNDFKTTHSELDQAVKDNLAAALANAKTKEEKLEVGALLYSSTLGQRFQFLGDLISNEEDETLTAESIAESIGLPVAVVKLDMLLFRETVARILKDAS